MSEAGMRKKVIRILRDFHAIPVENPIRPGTPDVNYVDGWIELKWRRDWPKRPETPVLISHFTDTQRRWLTQRRKSGGRAFLLLQIKDKWMLFEGGVAAETVGRVPKFELIAAAYRVWTGKSVEKGLPNCLSRLNNSPSRRDCSPKDGEQA